MIVTIDRAGRLVIPKPIRDAMGLRPGRPLTIDYVDGKISIEYARAEWKVEVAEDGLPVILYDGPGEPPVLTDEMIQEVKDADEAERDARWM